MNFSMQMENSKYDQSNVKFKLKPSRCQLAAVNAHKKGGNVGK